MVVSGLQAFQARLHACRLPQEAALNAEPGGSSHAGGSSGGGNSQAGRPPLFRVALALLQPEVVVAPSTGEVSKQLGRMLRNLVESAKPFVRWMDATCLEAPEQ
jgi:dynein heavy chain